MGVPAADSGFYFLNCPAHIEICLPSGAEASELLFCALLVMLCIYPAALAFPPAGCLCGQDNML